MSEAPVDAPALPLRDRLSRLFLGPPDVIARAPVTRWILLAAAVVFFAQLLTVKQLSALVKMPDRAMLLFGANYSPFVWGEHRYEVWVTSMFLHVSLLHILFNLYALRQVGPVIEIAAGSARFAVLYLFTGIIGSALSAAIPLAPHAALEPLTLLLGDTSAAERLSAGASGAICGVIGAAMVTGVRLQGWSSGLARSTGFWLLLTLAIGSRVHADNAAHLGGAIAGALVAASWRRGKPYTAAITARVTGACAAVVALAFVVVAARDLLDPYAAASSTERASRTYDAIFSGHCAEAREGAEATARLSPGQGRALAGAIARSCF